MLMNGTVLSSNDSHYNNVPLDVAKQGGDKAYNMSEQNINYNSDQNLHERRPFTSGIDAGVSPKNNFLTPDEANV